MSAVNKNAPGCSACTVAAPNHTVTVNSCSGTPEPGASVTVRRSSDSVVVATCTTGPNGQCGVELAQNINYTTTVIASTYTTSQSFFKSSFVSPNTSQTFNHPGCVCLNTWPATLNWTDPLGPIVLTRATGNSWGNVRMISAQGIARPADIGTYVLPPQPDCPGLSTTSIWHDCNKSTLSTINVRLSYSVTCSTVSFPVAGTFIDFSVQWDVCGWAQGGACQFEVNGPQPIEKWFADGTFNQAWNDPNYSGVGLITSTGRKVDICSRLCSDPPNFTFPVDFSSLGRGAGNATLTP